MNKKSAIVIFGTPAELARAVVVTSQAISQWPDQLTNDMELKVIGAAVRSGRWSCQEYRLLVEPEACRDAA